ncbi:MAG: HAMP domain-containing histidine kinase [Gammaproteobacteria bacterium]|nr:HAMP domain-containing histidine kinase [Gammaproteobacteria bacterium]MYG14318.1 HAMP domain-containing histidine kinase [Gammaproteobacteria bacterium]MYK45653.1 HAMP domain-containing histidine kinase [Gammaproteobacteria bacterium]
MIDLRGSLRMRIVFAFSVSSLVLSAAWSLGTISALRLTEDRVLERQLELIAEDYRRRVEADAGAARPDSAFVTSYRDPLELPPDLVQWALASPTAGFHEFTEEELHVAVLDADIAGAARFLVFDASGIEAPSSEDVMWFAGLAAVALMIGLGALAIGLLIGRLSVEPMVRLAEIVAEVDPERVGESDRKRIAAHRFGRNEAGLLANAIERMVARICAFTERERSFTAAASHELRTPVTVIRGALELLERAELPARARGVLERIRGANADMQATIEMFLSLARESNDLVDEEEIRVLAVVERAVEDCGPLLRAKDGSADVQADGDPVFEGHALAFATVVGNLLRNAIEHGPLDERPMIVIRLGASALEVRNRSERVSASTRSLSAGPAQGGLGLQIVNRLCDHNGWSFGLTENDRETTARLSWVRRRSP